MTLVRTRSPAVETVLRAGVIAASLAYVGLYAGLVLLRVRYPFELEWLEGQMVEEVRRLLDHRALYAAPTLDYIPLTYTPGYLFAGALVSRVMGVGLLPLRLLSIASSAGTLWLLFRMARRETGSRTAGWLAAGLFAASFGWTGGWFDLARNDSLFLLLATAALYTLRWHESLSASLAAGLLMSAAFLTKQTALIMMAPLACYAAWRGWRPLAAFAGIFAVVLVTSTWWCSRWWGDWYLYYILTLPSQHAIARESLVGFWRYDLARPFGVALLVCAAWVLLALRRREGRQAAVFYGLVLVSFAGAAWSIRLHSLSYVNVVLPAYEALALVFPVATHRLFESSSRRGWLRGPAAGLTLAAVQLAVVIYRPQTLVPTRADVEQGRALLARMADIRGDVYVPYHAWPTDLTGRPFHVHVGTLADVLRGRRGPVQIALEREWTRALEDRDFLAIIAPERSTVSDWLPIDESYRPADAVVTRQSRFWRPERLFVPR
jgi:hypothetical protein